MAVVSAHIMNFVEPIRDRKKLAQTKNMLRGEGRIRDLLLFTVGLNTAADIRPSATEGESFLGRPAAYQAPLLVAGTQAANHKGRLYSVPV